MTSPDSPTGKFSLPSEIVTERVLPTLRSMLAVELVDRGFTQEDIASRLGVTQAAVSTYVSGQVAVEDRIRNDPRTIQTVGRICDGLEANEMDPYEVLGAVMELVHELEDRGPICELHEEAMPSLDGLGCDLCVRGMDPDLGTERTVLSQVRNAARRLANTPELAGYVPNVGTNIGMGLPDATGVTDVAAIPGRIYVIGGRIEVPGNPEFGASEHVATAVLAAMRVEPGMRGAVNLTTDQHILDAAREKGVDPLEVDPTYEDRLDRLETAFERRGHVPRIIYHRGAFGIEPVLYVLGESAIEAVDLARDLVTPAE